MKILIVDDTPANINVLQKIFSESDFNISMAPNGEIALKIIQGDPPDLVLLDIMMPGIDGYEVCRRLKANTETSNIPVIFFQLLLLETIIITFLITPPGSSLGDLLIPPSTIEGHTT